MTHGQYVFRDIHIVNVQSKSPYLQPPAKQYNDTQVRRLYFIGGGGGRKEEDYDVLYLHFECFEIPGGEFADSM